MGKSKQKIKRKKQNYGDSYYDVSNPVSYSGARNILSKHPRDKEKIQNWLDAQNTYTLHKPIRKKFPRLHYNVYYRDQLWEADLVELGSIKSYNDGVTFLLVVIDVFSKYIWIEPLKNKTGQEVCKAFEKIFMESKRFPTTIQTDRGKEFIAKTVQELFSTLYIQFRVARNPDIKASIVERVNRTIKERMWRYFTHKKTYRYIDVLENMVSAYNHSWHSSIKMTPASVNNHNSDRVLSNIQNKHQIHVEKKFKYKVGDYVRISIAKSFVDKGYTQNYTDEIFQISKAYRRQSLPTYELIDLNKESIDSFFYQQELVKVNKNIEEEEFEVERIIETRGTGKKKEYLVAWKGYPAKFNSWIPASNLK